eukprot:CAMPEP_0206548630 /NCGR_PEP_ID=MMETSP0325_2-20121206/13994_1 /ASSEMBLY_ACC=CAM_ASM_000347 /TAXON_ID=2866 /ORGANISM="Crypthecodinium cohnii, Strain Seligo" /LENGTH=30 /DNA_ID= /DNA_START= /DNA_END= /DNA_ORIENTATION=
MKASVEERPEGRGRWKTTTRSVLDAPEYAT